MKMTRFEGKIFNSTCLAYSLVYKRNFNSAATVKIGPTNITLICVAGLNESHKQ